jgi:hypothetical protein
MTDPVKNTAQRDKNGAATKFPVQKRRHGVTIWSVLLLSWLQPLFAQVSPIEIKNPRLKELQQTHLQSLIALNHDVSEIKFPFKFSLNRQVGLDPKDQIGADTRGLEFVSFHERELLKFSGNYNAAFNADSLTPNQRAGRVLNEVILPILRLLPDRFNAGVPFDAFGFEIGYHMRRSNSSYRYEGKEILVVVLDKSDGLRYASLREDAQRQEILNRSEIYLNGSPLGLALNAAAPYEIEALVQRPSAKKTSASDRNNRRVANSKRNTASPQESAAPPSPASQTPSNAVSDIPSSLVAVGNSDLDALQKKYQADLESLRKEGVEKYHFVDYAPVSFISFHNQSAIQATLRNPEAFNKDTSSIYKRAARTFDSFLAPQLQGILGKIPQNPDFKALDFTVILDLTSATSPKSSEAVEYFLPLKSLLRLIAADITSQDLINESIVLVNGVRISLHLSQVE